MAFKVKHCIKSKTAEDNNINNVPGVDVDKDPCLTYNFIINNLQKLHFYCVNPIIQAFGIENIFISSAYRCIELNTLIGGHLDSPHIQGYAVDLKVKNYSSATLWNWCYQNLPNYHQLIWEYPELGEFSNNFDPCSWVHISYVENNNIRTSSFSSKRLDLHEMYKSENTNKRGNMTHNISLADNRII